MRQGARPEPDAISPQEGSTIRLAAFAWIVLSAFLWSSVAGSAAFAGDPALAKFLLKGGKDDLAKKQYDAALTKFERAEREDPSLLEAVYCQALSQDRRGDSRGAVLSYRRFMLAVETKSKAGAVPKDEAALAKTAQARVDILDAGVTERRKIDDDFVAWLIGFARTNLARDPGVAADALRLVTDLRPDHPEAKQLLDKIRASSPAAAGKPPDPAPGDAAAPVQDGFKAVRAWKDLLGLKYFGLREGWEYQADRLVIDKAGASVVRSPDPMVTGARYAIEADCRILESYGTASTIGFGFGFRDGNDFSLILGETDLVLVRTQSGKREAAARVELNPSGRGQWHRIGVVVQANKVEVWLDGTKRADYVVELRQNLTGELTVVYQDVKAEFRLLRFGEIG